MDEDVFDEDAPEISIIEKDWNKLNRSRMKDGFVAGSTAGQESTLQSGFNRGFKQGFVSSFLLAEIKGVLNALMSYRASYEGHPITDDVILDAQRLLDDVMQLEADCVAEDFFTMKINPHTSSGVHGSNYEHVDAAHSSLAALSMDVDETLQNNTSCACGESQSKPPSMNCCSDNNVPLSHSEPSQQCQRKLPGSLSTRSERYTATEMKLEEVKKLLLSCPEIEEVVQRCKHILKRLRWTDVMIDNLL